MHQDEGRSENVAEAEREHAAPWLPGGGGGRAGCTGGPGGAGHGPQPRSIAQRVALELAGRIVSGELEAGTWLTEVDVAAQTGVSRTPVREAILQLQVWGLVRLAPKKGAMVTIPSALEQADLLEVRSMLETGVVRRVAQCDAATREALADRLRAIVARQREVIDDPAAFAREDYAFHAELITHGENAVVAEISGLLGPRLARLTFLAVRSMSERLSGMADEHEALVGTIERGDADGFAALIERHLADGHRRYAVSR